jgi:hypothetical protein
MRDDGDGGGDGDDGVVGQKPDWQQRVTKVQRREAFSCPKFSTKYASDKGDASKPGIKTGTGNGANRGRVSAGVNWIYDDHFGTFPCHESQTLFL